MLATVPSATLLGVEGRAGHRRSPCVERAARRSRSSGYPMPRAASRETGCAARVLSSGLGWPLKRITVNLAPSGAAQRWLRARPRDRVGRARRRRPARRGAGRRPVVPRPSSASTARCGGCRACVPLAAVDAAAVHRRAARLRDRGRARAPRAGAGRGDAHRARATRCAARRRGPTSCTARRRRARRPVADLARRPGARARPARGRGRGRGRPSPPDGGPAGLGQDDARDAAARACSPPLTPARRRSRSRSCTRRPAFALPRGGLVRHPPFRAPHHSSSMVSLVGGGGASMRPGELSLANTRRALSRRARRVHRARARRPPPAARGGRRAGESGRGERRVPGQGAARRGDEPVPVRRGRTSGRVPVQRGGATPLHPAGVGPARRSVRPARPGHAAERRRAHGTGGAARRRPRSRGAGRRRSRRSPGARGVETNADIDAARLDELAPLDAVRRPRCFAASSRPVGCLAVGSTECDGSPARCATSTAATTSSPTGTSPSRCSCASSPVAHDGALRA